MFLALGEMRRAPWRFALLTGAVGLLVFLILFVQALTGALIGQFIGALKHQSADVLVYSAQARKNLEGSFVPPATVDAVGAVPGVAASGPFGEGTFSVRAANELRDAALIGYDPGKPGVPTTLTEGRLPTAPFEVVASHVTGTKVSASAIMSSSRRGAAPSPSSASRVTSTTRSFPRCSRPSTRTPPARRDAYPDATAVWPSAVAVAVAPGSSAAAVRDEINARIQGVEALTRDQAVRESPGVASVGASLGAVVFLCFLVVAIVAGLFFLILTVQKASALTLLRRSGSVPACSPVRSSSRW